MSDRRKPQDRPVVETSTDLLGNDEEQEPDRKIVSPTEMLSHRHDKLQPQNTIPEPHRRTTVPDDVKYDKESEEAVKMMHKMRRESGTDRESERGKVGSLAAVLGYPELNKRSKAQIDTMGMADTLNEGEALLERNKKFMGGTPRKRYDSPQPDI